MPELPEVETTRRGIAPHVSGKAVQELVVRDRRLRWPIPEDLPAQLRGQTLREVRRRGKYLLLQFDHGTALWHLGMSGSLRIVQSTDPVGKHDHVDMVFPDGLALRFNDPRRFGALLWTDESVEQHKLLQHLGPEPLTDDFSGDYLFGKSRKRTQPVKTWLMDSRMVVGVGNIYANEALFRAGIHPLRKTARLSARECQRLAEEIKSVLAYAIERGGTTLRDFVGGDGKPGYFAQELSVYGRGALPCKSCSKPLTERRLGQRTTVYCTVCQK
jgi:formamidopyrimidine-DNA glycosylase